jgi:hypothetical protein
LVVAAALIAIIVIVRVWIDVGQPWLATRFQHKSMAAGLECSPMGATGDRPCRPA